MIEKKQFTGKLNTDVADHALPAEDFVNAQNVRVSSGRAGDVAALQPVEGTVLQSYDPVLSDSLPHQCVGVLEDRANNRLFYFLYSTSGNHKILMYSNGVVTKMVHNDDITGDLNFQENNYIDTALAGGVLYFTDGVNEPRKIEVDSILSGEYTVSNTSELTLFATPPMIPIEVEKIDSVDAGLRSLGSSNNMIDEAFQFSYRFIYEDNSVSVIAPYSKLVNYEDEDDVAKDAARITIPVTQTIPSRVKRVEVLYREGNIGSWFVFDDITSDSSIEDHNNGSPIIMTFYNDKTGIAVADEQALKPFDLIPRTAKTLDIAKDRLFLGNLLVGYDKYFTPDLMAVESIESPEGGVTEVVGRYYTVSWRRTDEGDRSDRYILIRLFDEETYDGFYLIKHFEGNPDSAIYPFPTVITVNEDSLIVNQSDFEDLVSEMGSDSAALIRALEEYEGIYNELDPPSTPTSNDSYAVQPNTAQVLGVTDPISITGQHFKCNGRYKLGIVFYDEYGRNAGVYTNNELIVETAPRTYQQFYFTEAINWSLSNNSNIPLWARSYSIVRTKNLNSDFFIQSPAGLITYAVKEEDNTYTFQSTFDVGTVTNIAVSIQSLIKDGLGYSFTEGDNIRLLTSDGGVDITLRIEGQYGKYLILESRDIGDLSNDTGKSTGLFEIFNTTGFGETFYEVGEHFLINNAGEANRAYSTTSGVLNGDTFVKPRTTGANTQINVEAMSINDRRWEDWVQDIGRTNLELLEASEERLPNTIRYSNTYVQSTKVNGLSSFDLLDREDIDENAGDIYSLVYTSSTNDSSNVLLAICTNNTASVYIGQTQIIDDSGGSILATSGNVIGTVNILSGDYGTVNPESVALNDGKVYWFDRNLRKVVIYNSNGLFELSSSGIQRLMENTNKATWMPAGFDDKHGEYLLTINTNTGQRLTPLNDFYEQALGGVMLDFVGVVEDDVTLIPKSSGGYHSLNSTTTGRTYEAKVAASNGSVTIRVGGVVVATLSNGESYEFYAGNSQLVEASISSGQAAWVMEKKRSWYNPWDHKAKTLVFSKDSKGFVGTRSYVSDLLSSLNDDLFTWKNGSIHKHNGPINTFYGVKYNSSISLVFNKFQPLPQVARGVYVESDVAPYVQLRTELPYVQSTDITPSEFRRMDGVWYGKVQRDRLTPSLDYNVGLKRGNVMRGQFIKAYISFTSDFRMRFINLEVQQDRGHKLITT